MTPVSLYYFDNWSHDSENHIEVVEPRHIMCQGSLRSHMLVMTKHLLSQHSTLHLSEPKHLTGGSMLQLVHFSVCTR